MKKHSQTKQKSVTSKKLESSSGISVGDFAKCKKDKENKYHVTKSNVYVKVVSFDMDAFAPNGINARVCVVLVDGKKKEENEIVGEEYLVDIEDFEKVDKEEMNVHMI